MARLEGKVLGLGFWLRGLRKDLDGTAQGRFRVLDCAARGEGFGFGIAWREEKVLGLGFWLRGVRKVLLDCAAR